MSKIVMSDEQFERLLKAVTKIGRTYTHVCPPCTRPHYPNWQYKHYYPFTVYTSGTTSPTILKVEG